VRAASGALLSLLNSSSQVFVADLLTITQQGGTVTRLTTAGTDLSVVSSIDATLHTFTSGLPFTRGRTKIILGLEVDTLQVTLMPDPLVHTIGGVPWGQAARTGAFDEATVVVERVFMATYGDVSAGTLIQFSGRVGAVTPTRGAVVLEVRSAIELLAMQLPRNVYQAGCLHTLYDSACGLLRATFSVTGVAQAGSTAQAVNTGLAAADGYYALGTMTFTTGANTGLVRTIKSFTSNTATAIVAWPTAPAIGDAYSISAGCDKQQATCSTKFANLVHFRGVPYIPHPESAL